MHSKKILISIAVSMVLCSCNQKENQTSVQNGDDMIGTWAAEQGILNIEKAGGYYSVLVQEKWSSYNETEIFYYENGCLFSRRKDYVGICNNGDYLIFEGNKYWPYKQEK
jgi:hypothetical protein